MALFLKSKYETEPGLIVRCEMSEDEDAVAGTEPAAVADLNVTAYVSGGRRRNGIHCRGANLSRILGTAPDTFKKTSFVVLRSIADKTAAAYQPGQTLTIGGVVWTIDSLRDEKLV